MDQNEQKLQVLTSQDSHFKTSEFSDSKEIHQIPERKREYYSNQNIDARELQEKPYNNENNNNNNNRKNLLSIKPNNTNIVTKGIEREG